MKFTKNDKGQVVATFSAELLSISDDANIQKNVNGTEYRIAGIKFVDNNGVEQKTTAVMYESNFKHGVEIGESYLTQATQTDQGVWMQVSHLTSITNRATADMFGFAEASIEAEIKEKSLEETRS